MVAPPLTTFVFHKRDSNTKKIKIFPRQRNRDLAIQNKLNGASHLDYKTCKKTVVNLHILSATHANFVHKRTCDDNEVRTLMIEPTFAYNY